MRERSAAPTCRHRRIGNVETGGQLDAFVLALDAATGAALTNFGIGGVQKFGGTQFDQGTALAISGTTLYVGGIFNSTDAGIGGQGAFVSTGSDDGFVIALNATTGAAVGSFGSSGMQRFGGSNSDQINALTVIGTTLYAAGTFSSTNAGVGGQGTFQTAGGNDAFVVALTSTGTAAMTFGTNGLVKFGGTLNDTCTAIAQSNGNLYLTGYFNSTNAQINGVGTAYAPLGNRSGYVLALNGTSGAPISSFSVNGLQKLGGTDSDVANDIFATTSTVYVAGNLFSSNFGIGTLGTVGTSGQTGSSDAFVVALNTADGKGLAGFGTGGIQTYGGLNDESGNRVALAASTLYLAGTSNSDDAGVGGRGSFVNSDFGGFAVPLSATGGTAAFPVMPGPFVIGGVAGSALNYNIPSIPTGTAFSTGALPSGLSLNASTD